MLNWQVKLYTDTVRSASMFAVHNVCTYYDSIDMPYNEIMWWLTKKIADSFISIFLLKH